MSEAARPRLSGKVAALIVALLALGLNWLVEWRGRPPEPSRNPPLPYNSTAVDPGDGKPAAPSE